MPQRKPRTNVAAKRPLWSGVSPLRAAATREAAEEAMRRAAVPAPLAAALALVAAE